MEPNMSGDRVGEKDPLLRDDLPTEAEGDEMTRVDSTYWRCSTTLTNTVLAIFVVLGVALFTGGIVAVKDGPRFIEDMLQRELPITNPGSKLFSAWQDPAAGDALMQRKYYWFNVTNPHAVAKGAPPDLDEIGPYVYRERRFKHLDSISWLVDTQIQFKYQSDFYFDAEASIDRRTGRKLTESDHIVTMNQPLFGIAYRLGKMPNVSLGVFNGQNFTKKDLCVALNIMLAAYQVLDDDRVVGPAGYFVNRNVSQLLWGYVDPIWGTMHPFSGPLFQYPTPSIFRTEWNGTSPAPGPYDGRHGQECPMWNHMEHCNTSSDRYTREYSGAVWGNHGSPQDIGNVTYWAGNDRMWWWGEEGTCQTIQGSGGMRWRRNMGPADRPNIFVDMLYRKVELQWYGKKSFKGIDAENFGIAQSELDFGPNSKCYFQTVRGVFNLTAPMFVPAYVTKAHYLDTDTAHVNLTMGGKPFPPPGGPDRAKYETYITMHSLTGSTLDAAARAQVSTQMGPLKVDGCPGVFSDEAQHLPTTWFPALWEERTASISDSLAAYFRAHMLLYRLLHDGGIACIVVGLLLMIGCSSALLYRSRKAKAKATAVDSREGVMQ